MEVPAPKAGDIVTFVAADGKVDAGAAVLHVWEPSVATMPPLLNLRTPGSPTSVPHVSQVRGADGFYWR